MSNELMIESIKRSIQSSIPSKSENVFVGYSGGVDSSVLLYLCVELFGADKVTALHVHHGISAHADDWLKRCEAVCRQLRCQLISDKVSVEDNGRITEEAARNARYESFARNVPKGAVLLLAHHLDDQVETFFLRLLRGSGPHGLVGMTASSQRDHYQLVRPLLTVARADIVSVAERLNIPWLEDESNQESIFNRNYLRNDVLPLIEQRWPKYRQQVGAFMQSLTETNSVNASLDVQGFLSENMGANSELTIPPLMPLTNPQKMQILHQWLVRQNLQVPSKAWLSSLVSDVVNSAPDAQPVLRLGDGEIRRFDNRLSWQQSVAAPGHPPRVALGKLVEWHGVGSLGLVPARRGSNRFRAGLPNLSWKLRSGGEMIHPQGRQHRRDLKRLFQELKIETWLRDRVPLLFSDNRLVAIGDYVVDKEFSAASDEAGLRVQWQRASR